MFKQIAIAALAAAAVCVMPASAAQAIHILDVVDRAPKFEHFYNVAASEKLDEASRWALWQKDYGIAAVPPTPAGNELARHQLDTAWPRYAALLPRLPALAAAAEQAGRELFARVNALYATRDVAIHSKLILFVGQFDDNEFTVPAMDGAPPTVVMPIESPRLRVNLAHELSHSVHFQLAHVKNSFGAPIGETVFLEGLAMRASKAVVPGLPDALYTELANEPGWLARCTAKRAFVMKGIVPYLDSKGADAATKFTFGQGTTGMDRELYCAGWFVVGKLLDDGKSFPQLARIPEDRMVQTVRDAIVGH